MSSNPAFAAPARSNFAVVRRVRHALTRVTSGGRYIPIIDGLRFVAIAAVVLYHLNDFLVHKQNWTNSPDIRNLLTYRILNVGNCGVQLFFAISGFILGLPFLERISQNEPLKLAPYFLRRLTRLEPPYIINLFISVGLLIAVKGESLGELLAPLAASMGYVHNLVYGELSRINGVAWSLEIEVQFYLIAPLLAWSFYRLPRPLRRSLVLSLITLAVIGKVVPGQAADPRIRLSLLYHYEHFLVGMLLADVYLTDWHRTPPQHRAYDLLGTVAWCAVVCVQWSPLTTPLIAPAALAAYYCSFRGPALSWLLSRPWITTIGGMCYTIYLYHFYVISVVGGNVLSAGGSGMNYFPLLVLLVISAGPAIVVSSAILFALFEKPFMVWRPLQLAPHSALIGTHPRARDRHRTDRQSDTVSSVSTS